MNYPAHRCSTVDEIESIRISLASPDDIRSWSSGEVTESATFDESDGSAITGGLFCEAIFGPRHDWRCECGNIWGDERKNRYCDICDRFPTFQPRRQTRMGHIELACPIVHPWFYAAFHPPLSLLLNLKREMLRKLVQYDLHLVTDAGSTSWNRHELLAEQQVLQSRKNRGEQHLQTLSGAEAIRHLVHSLDLAERAHELRQQISDSTSGWERTQLQTRLRLIESLRDSGNDPAWMILEVIPVVSPFVRPSHQNTQSGAEHGLNELYRQVICRNGQLRKVEALAAPERVVVLCRKRLQQKVDELFDGLRPPIDYGGPRAYETSLKHQLKHDMRTSFPLGKPVDFSARSVVVPNSKLRLDQCGLPKNLALTLYEPLVIRQLLEQEHASTSYLARTLVSQKAEVVWDALVRVMRDHWVLLSRPPSTSRRRLQAFQPSLVEGNAIHIHPLLAPSFGVEFSGEQLKVYLPLSNEAQTEAKLLVSCPNTLLDTQAGQLTILPENDVVIGCHYLTAAKPDCRGAGMVFSSPAEAVSAWEHDRVDLHATVRVRLASDKPAQTGSFSSITESATASAPVAKRIIETTVGRVLFNEALPDEMDYYDLHLNAPMLSQVIGDCTLRVGRERTMRVLEAITRLAHQHLSSSGMSLGMRDLLVPESKAKIQCDAESQVAKIKKLCTRGIITENEAYYKELDSWSHARERTTSDLMSELLSGTQMSLLSLWAESNAATPIRNLQQLGGMMGLMSDIHGWIQPIPIKANFREGLPVTEYWRHIRATRQGLLIECRNSRRNRDYWERLSRLLQDMVITMADCGTQQSVSIEPDYAGSRCQPLQAQARGRVAFESIVHPVTEETVVGVNALITHEVASKMDGMGLKCLKVRSPMTCEAPVGICQRCYGMDHSTQDLVEVGTAIGVHAVFAVADAIERIGKVKLRTFTMGSGVRLPMDYGTFQESLRSLQSETLSGEEVEIRAKKGGIVDLAGVDVATGGGTTGHGTVLRNGAFLKIRDHREMIIERYPVPKGATLRVEHGQAVLSGQSICIFEAFVDKVIARVYGIGMLRFDGDDAVVYRNEDGTVVIRQEDLPRHPRIVISDELGAVLEVHYLGADYRIAAGLVDPMVPARVVPGSVLAQWGQHNVPSIGLSPTEKRTMLIGFLESRTDFSNRMTLAPIDAKVLEVERLANGSHQILLAAPDGRYLTERVRKYPRVHPGDEVRAGDPLTDGTPSLFDLLEVRGLTYTMNYLKHELKEVFLRDRIDLAGQHIELVISRLLSRARISDPGDSNLLIDTMIERSALKRVNHELSQRRRVTNGGDSHLPVGELILTSTLDQVSEHLRRLGRQPPQSSPVKLAIGKVVLQGMTKAGFGRSGFLTESTFRDLRTVLINAALAGNADELGSLSSNVTLGRLIPAGTGHRSLRNAQVRRRFSPLEQLSPNLLEEDS